MHFGYTELYRQSTIGASQTPEKGILPLSQTWLEKVRSLAPRLRRNNSGFVIAFLEQTKLSFYVANAHGSCRISVIHARNPFDHFVVINVKKPGLARMAGGRKLMQDFVHQQ